MEKRGKTPTKQAQPGKPASGVIPPPMPRGPLGKSDVAKRPPARPAGRNR